MEKVLEQDALRPRSNWGLLALALSATAGAVDVIGYIALGGLFTAHITGNLAVLAAHLVAHTPGGVATVLAVPVFMLVLGVISFLAEALERAGHPPLRPLLVLHAALLGAFLAMGVVFGPFNPPDGALAVFAGMLGVAAMATQNATVKAGLRHAPSTAAMTANVTQLALDVATLANRRGGPQEQGLARRRARASLPCVAGFILGALAGAGLQLLIGLWSLGLPVLLAVAAVVLEREPQPSVTTPSRTP